MAYSRLFRGLGHLGTSTAIATTLSYKNDYDRSRSATKIIRDEHATCSLKLNTNEIELQHANNIAHLAVEQIGFCYNPIFVCFSAESNNYAFTHPVYKRSAIVCIDPSIAKKLSDAQLYTLAGQQGVYALHESHLVQDVATAYLSYGSARLCFDAGYRLFTHAPKNVARSHAMTAAIYGFSAAYIFLPSLLKNISHFDAHVTSSRRLQLNKKEGQTPRLFQSDFYHDSLKIKELAVKKRDDEYTESISSLR